MSACRFKCFASLLGFHLLLFTPLAFANPAPNSKEQADDWRGFRQMGSEASSDDLPLTWSVTENIQWRQPLEGAGQSSPVIWKDRVYITSVSSGEPNQLLLYCFDLKKGALQWKASFNAGKQIEYSRAIARAAPTPAVNKNGVFLFFGTGDLIRVTHQGKTSWSRNLIQEFGDFKGNHGVGSSPILYKDRLYLLVDHAGPSYLLALMSETGKTLWKKDRPERVSWSTPTMVYYQEKPRIVISSNGRVEALNPEDGTQLWFTDNIEKNTVASPTAAKTLIIAGSSKAKETTAIRLGGQGELKDANIAWKGGVATSFGSPLFSDGDLYFVNRAGAITCVSADKGTVIWQHRLGESCWASPFKAGNNLYFFGKSGRTMVLKSGSKTPVVLADNKLPVEEEDAVYGVAVGKDHIMVRTASELLSIGK